MLEKKEKVLQKKAAAEVEKGKEFTKAKNKRVDVASFCLFLEHLGAKAATETVDALRTGAAATKAMQKATNIDVDKTMDEINEQTENTKQIQEALATPIGATADFGESSGRVSNLCKSDLNRNLIVPLCSSSRDEARKANPVAKSHLMHPHAPPHLRRVRSSLGHKPHALQRKRMTAPHVLHAYHAPTRQLAHSFDEFDGRVVLMGNGNACKMMGIGTIRLKMYNGTIKVLTDVRYVPDLKKNLISLGDFDSEGYKIILEGGVLKVVSGALIVLKGTCKGNLYYLDGRTITRRVAVSNNTNNNESDTSRLWHLCLG
ncbi:SNF7 family protein [Actinidia rufa]|uniref:SNF7 family protein n=1 Tax=Actinidia rufa TaxID=165716 RepID=A0A7J0DBZ3_9ERIC|nr:SNF7 family protein [Actinidia rufa]